MRALVRAIHGRLVHPAVGRGVLDDRLTPPAGIGARLRDCVDASLSNREPRQRSLPKDEPRIRLDDGQSPQLASSDGWRCGWFVSAPAADSAPRGLTEAPEHLSSAARAASAPICSLSATIPLHPRPSGNKDLVGSCFWRSHTT